jgi:hypothetical protein
MHRKYLKYLLFLLLINLKGNCQTTQIDSIPERIITLKTSFGKVTIQKTCDELSEHLSMTYSFGNMDENIYDEAVKLKIKCDKAYVTFIVNSNCKIADFKFTKKGQINSFNNFVTQFCNEIIKKLNENDNNILTSCPNRKCENFTIPIIITVP